MKTLFLLCFLLGSAPSFASTQDPGIVLEEAPTAKQHSAWGLYGSLIGDPGLNSIGVNLAYQFNEDWRGILGFGIAPLGWTSIGVGVNYFVQTGSRFRPFFGLGLTDLMINLDFGTVSSSWSFHSFSAILANFKTGVEYQAPSGFFVGLHWSLFYAFQGNLAETSSFAVIPIPALSIGSFF